VAIRIAWSFRTILAAAAAVLAGLPPFELLALRCRKIYLRTRGLLDGVGAVDAVAEARWTRSRRRVLGESCSTDGAPASTQERALRGYGSSGPSSQTGTFGWTETHLPWPRG
jgi:hypothetical protein